jgi:RNA polymerase sigma factor (sigma-70 family)
MDGHDGLAERFEEHRPHLRAVAYRMLGSLTEADDAVQEAWLRISRSETDVVENLGGWLTTVVARVCLNVLRARRSRREEPMGPRVPEPIARPLDGGDPEQDALLADSVGLALLVVLDTLGPAERVAFVLHDVFDVSFEEIAPIVGRSSAAARRLASRARRRVRRGTPGHDADLAGRRSVVDAFLAAARDGDFAALLALLDPEVVLRADDAAVARPRSRLSKEVRGAAAVAKEFAGRARVARPALVNGSAGLAWAPGGRPLAVFNFTIAAGKIAAIDVIADPARVRQLDVVILDG